MLGREGLLRSRYDTQRNPFQQTLKDAFAVNRLDTLRSDARQAFTRERDQSSAYHQLFYRLARTEEFLALYDAFIREVIRLFYGEAIELSGMPIVTLHPGHNCMPSAWVGSSELPDLGRWSYRLGWSLVRYLNNGATWRA